MKKPKQFGIKLILTLTIWELMLVAQLSSTVNMEIEIPSKAGNLII